MNLGFSALARLSNLPPLDPRARTADLPAPDFLHRNAWSF